jgi:hypothetical protein
LGARILKVVLDFDTLEAKGVSKRDAMDQLKQRSEWYDPAILKALEEILGIDNFVSYDVKEVSFRQLSCDMVLGQDVITKDELLLVSKGQEVNMALLQRLKNFSITVGIKEPIQVYVPRNKACQDDF